MKRTNKNNRSIIENLEGRQMFSATPAVVGYLPDYEYNQQLMTNLQATNAQGEKFQGMTQINYFSVLPDANGVLPGTSVTDANGNVFSNTTTTTSNGASNPLSNLDAVVTAAHQAGVKVDIVVGGAGDFSTVLGNVIGSGTEGWNNFAASAVQFCNHHHLDGVDIDWEAGYGEASPAQITDYGYFLGTLKQSAGNLNISAAVDAEKLTLSDNSQAYALDTEAVQSVNTINIMAYDLGNPADNAPLQQTETDMTNWASYVDGIQGGSHSQLIFGVPFYGKATTIDPSIANQWPLVSNNSKAVNVDEATYNEIVTAAGNSVDYSMKDVAQSVQKLSVPGTFNNNAPAETWNFDNRGAVYAKTQFALQQGYGGVLAWSIGQDYGASTSTGFDQNKSLMPAINQAISDFNGTPVSGTTGTTPQPPVVVPPVIVPPVAQPTGNDTITGTIFNDANGNGTQGKHEAGLAGMTVYLDLNGNGSYEAGEPTAVTNAQGQFTFTGLADGNYIVRVEQPSNYHATTECAQDGDLVNVIDGQTGYCGLFGEQKIS